MVWLIPINYKLVIKSGMYTGKINDIAIGQFDMKNLFAIDKCAVWTAQIGEEIILFEIQVRVMLGHRDIIKNNIIVGTAANGCTALFQIVIGIAIVF